MYRLTVSSLISLKWRLQTTTAKSQAPLCDRTLISFWPWDWSHASPIIPCPHGDSNISQYIEPTNKLYLKRSCSSESLSVCDSYPRNIVLYFTEKCIMGLSVPIKGHLPQKLNKGLSFYKPLFKNTSTSWWFQDKYFTAPNSPNSFFFHYLWGQYLQQWSFPKEDVILDCM